MPLVELEKITYDDIYPPFIPYGSSVKPPALGSTRVRLPAPHYLLGWVVKLSPEAENTVRKYEDFVELQAGPIFRELGYGTGAPLREQGLTLPKVWRCGKHHALFQVALNYHRGIAFVSTEAGKKSVITRALQVYKMDAESFPDFPVDNLVWVRWPAEPGAGEGFPCVGEFDGKLDGGKNIPAPLADILNHKYRSESDAQPRTTQLEHPKGY